MLLPVGRLSLGTKNDEASHGTMPFLRRSLKEQIKPLPVVSLSHIEKPRSGPYSGGRASSFEGAGSNPAGVTNLFKGLIPNPLPADAN